MVGHAQKHKTRNPSLRDSKCEVQIAESLAVAVDLGCERDDITYGVGIGFQCNYVIEPYSQSNSSAAVCFYSADLQPTQPYAESATPHLTEVIEKEDEGGWRGRCSSSAPKLIKAACFLGSPIEENYYLLCGWGGVHCTATITRATRAQDSENPRQVT